MPTTQDSPAVAVARAHIEAWSNHDFDAARQGLAEDVHVIAMTTQPNAPVTDLTGADNYLPGLIQFAQTVVPGSARILASVGDEHNALVMLTVDVDFGGQKAILPGARLYLLDEHNKIKTEQVVFYAVPA
jgi:SnoaL-like domain